MWLSLRIYEVLFGFGHPMAEHSETIGPFSTADAPRSKRHGDILRLVREQGTCAIAELAAQLNVSNESIRRDIKPLTVSGQLVKLHGAVTLPHHIGEAPFERRMRENQAAKREIAQLAAQTVADGDTLMLDTGTTTSILARELLKKRNLTVITNSSDIARTLATVNGNTVFMAGGQLRGDNAAAFGSSAIEFIRKFRVRHAIVSIGAIDAQTGPMDNDYGEAEFANAVLQQGERAAIITDNSKFGRSGLVRVCDFSDFDVLITNQAPPPAIAARLTEAQVEVLTPQAENRNGP
jgi:DeoR family glycerol-3-phosphate regulon repressor